MDREQALQVQDQGAVAESRFAWIRLFLFRWLWLDARSLTPTEMDLRRVIDGKDAEIADLKEQLAAAHEVQDELRKEAEEKDREWECKVAALNVRIDALTDEVEVATEMHNRVLLRIRAESVAYAARIPPDDDK